MLIAITFAALICHMKITNLFLAVVLTTIPVLAQKTDSTAIAAGKTIVNKFPSTRVFDLQYQQFGSSDYTAKAFGNVFEKGTIRSHYRLRAAANINLYKSKSQRFFITNSFRYKYESFSFGNIQNATVIFTRPETDFHYFANAISGTYFGQIFKKNVIYNATAAVDADQYHFQRLKGMVSAVVVIKKTERTTFTLGALLSIDPSAIIPFVPIASYEYQFKESPWKLDFILPQRFLIKRPLFENGRLSLGTEMASENFYLSLNTNSFRGTYELNELALRSGITYEHALGKNSIGTFKSGLSNVLSSRITERGERTDRYVIDNKQDPHWYFNAGLSYNPF